MGFWQQLLSVFGPAPDTKPSGNEYFQVPPEPSSASSAPPSPSPGASGSWLARWRPRVRQETQLASLQAGYIEMVDLIRSIRQQLDSQNQVQQKMIGVLEKLPESMDQLKGVKDIAARQSETLDLLRQQMKTDANQDERMMDSLNRFNQTLQVMDETSRASSKTVEDMLAKSRETEKLLAVAFQHSERRLLLFLLLFLVVIAAGIAPIVYWNAPAPKASRLKKRAVPVQPVIPPPPVTNLTEDIVETVGEPALLAPAPSEPGEPVTPSFEEP